MKRFIVLFVAAIAACASSSAQKAAKPDPNQNEITAVRSDFRPVLIGLDEIALQMDVPAGEHWTVKTYPLTLESKSPTRVEVISETSFGSITVDAYRTDVGSPMDLAARQAEFLLLSGDDMVVSQPAEERLRSAVSFTYVDTTEGDLQKGKVITISPENQEDVVLLIYGRWAPFLNDEMTSVMDAMSESVAVAWPPQDSQPSAL